MTNAAFSNDFKRARRIESFGGHWCALWAKHLRRTGVELPADAQRHIRFRVLTYRIAPPQYPQPRDDHDPGLLQRAAALVGAWLTQVPVERRAEELAYDVVYTC